MKFVFVFVLCAAVLALVCCQEEKFTTKYDNVNLEDVFNNKRLLNAYIECALEEGPCTKEAQTLKESIPDALATKCGKCNDKQKKGAKYVLKKLVEEHPESYKKLAAKYDPDGSYRKEYADFAKEEGIKLDA